MAKSTRVKGIARMRSFRRRSRMSNQIKRLFSSLSLVCGVILICGAAVAGDDPPPTTVAPADLKAVKAEPQLQSAPTLRPAAAAPVPTGASTQSTAATSIEATISLVAGEEPSADSQINETLTTEALQAKKEEVESELRVAMMHKEAETSADATGSAKPQANASQIDKLKQIDVIVAQQRSVTASLEDINSKSVELEKKLNTLDSGKLEEQPPYSILLFDQLSDSITNLKSKKEAIAASLMSARDAVVRAKEVVENHKKIFRQLKEKATTETDPALQAADLDIRLAEESLVLERQELSVEESSEIVRSLQQAIDEKKLSLVGSRVEFDKSTLNEQIAELDSREAELKRKDESLRVELQYAERRWLTARQELDSTPSPGSELLERVESLKIEQQSIQYEQTAINQHLQRLPVLRNAWDRRFLVASGLATRDQQREWLSETQRQVDQLARDRHSRELKVDEVRVTIASVDAKIDSVATSSPEARRWLENRRQSLSKQIETCNTSILAIDSALRTLGRLQQQINGQQSRTVTACLSDAWLTAHKVLDYELTSIDDTSVTVGKVASSLLFLFFGYFAARWLSQVLGKRLPKLGIDEAGANAIESLSFYMMLVMFALGALRYSNVPLTVFTFLGGAIAIGVGFGSQNIVNNFISGLILLAERPIKVGDLIRIDNFDGNVTKIGARSTQIRTGENLDIIVPNSKFLENNVVNLTRRDDRLRTSICIGVAYGSNLELVIQLLEQAATEHPAVNERPKPFVWFNDFADNSLSFQVHFWINARTTTQMRKIETDVRLAIDRLFREQEVIIAFPQRDLHIQSLRPLEFRMIRDDEQDGRLRQAS